MPVHLEWVLYTAYHCVENASYDLMHDCDEGSWDVDLCLLIQTLIKKGPFPLQTLNNRVESFDWGPCESANKPTTTITEEHLKKKKFK